MTYILTQPEPCRSFLSRGIQAGLAFGRYGCRQVLARRNWLVQGALFTDRAKNIDFSIYWWGANILAFLFLQLALNYAPCFVPQQKAQALGYQQNLWHTQGTVTECE